MFCRNCSFSGDSIELYGLVHRNSNLETAVDSAVHEGIFTGEQTAFQPAAVLNYVNSYPRKRQQVDLAWKKLRANLGQNVQPELLHRVQKLNLWGNWNRGRNGLAQFMGGGSCYEINTAFGKELLPKNGFKTALALTYQDVPGRISMLHFIGDHDNILFKPVMPGNTTANPEGGLGMLDLLDSNEDEVIAIGDAIFALQLQRRHTVDSTEPLKIVFYNDTTERSWESVSARKIIFWAPEIDWRIFNQARLAKNGFISTRPQIENTREEQNAFLARYPAFEVVRLMKQAAKPWMEFFSLWALDAFQKESLVRETVNRLNLSSTERQQIIELTPRCGRVRLDHMLSSAAVAGRTIVVNNRNLVEKTHGWFLKSDKHEEQILDVSIRLFREITDPESEKVYWHGGIVHAARMVEFVTLLDEIETDPVRWMRSVMVKAGFGVPQLNPNWKRHFVYILKNLNAPKQVTLSTRLGIQLDGSIKLPTFSIVEGKCIEEENFLDPVSTPGLCLRPPLDRMARSGDEHNELRTAVLCGFVSLVHGWLSGLREMPVSPTIFVGPLGSVAHAAVRHLSKTLGLPRKELRFAWHPNFQRIETCARMNMPSCVETHGYGLLRDFPNPLNEMMFLQADRVEATALVAGGNWLQVKAGAINRETRPLPPADDLLNYLIDLQLRSFELDPGCDLLETLIADFCKWYQGYLGPQELLEPAMRQMLCAPPQPADALLDICFYLKQAGKITISLDDLKHFLKNGAVDDRRVQFAGIVYSKVHSAVYVSRGKVVASLLRDRLPTVDFVHATRDLAQRRLNVPEMNTPYGWLIQKEYWDERLALWQKEL